jgi:hypothetical protein
MAFSVLLVVLGLVLPFSTHGIVVKLHRAAQMDDVIAHVKQARESELNATKVDGVNFLRGQEVDATSTSFLELTEAISTRHRKTVFEVCNLTILFLLILIFKFFLNQI